MGRLSQGIRLAEVLTMPGGIASLARTRPFSTSAFVLARDLRAGCGAMRTVIDVGANVGQFSVAMARENPEARIVAVEPLPDVAAELRANTADHDRIRVLSYAAGAVTSTVGMHRHEHTKSSSLLPVTADFDAVFPGSQNHGEIQTVEVDVARLDDLVPASEIVGPTLLKLDVQGFEIEALKGASALLERCDWVLAEAAVERVYEGEPLFDELYAHLRDAGFVFDRPVDLLRGARGTVSQMDVLFRRQGTPHDHRSRG